MTILEKLYELCLRNRQQGSTTLLVEAIKNRDNEMGNNVVLITHNERWARQLNKKMSPNGIAVSIHDFPEYMYGRNQSAIAIDLPVLMSAYLEIKEIEQENKNLKQENEYVLNIYNTVTNQYIDHLERTTKIKNHWLVGILIKIFKLDQ